jgi:hypothetical protein
MSKYFGMLRLDDLCEESANMLHDDATWSHHHSPSCSLYRSTLDLSNAWKVTKYR